MQQNLMLVGSYPPPYGGCSVHMERLRRAVESEYDVVVVDPYGAPAETRDTNLIRCGIVRPRGAWRALRALRSARDTIVHFHVAGMDAFLLAGFPLLAALPGSARKVVTIHSGSFIARFERGAKWRRALLVNLLRRFDRIVTVNDAQRAFIERLGIDRAKMTVVPAFLPPVARASDRARAVLASIGGCDRIVIASGSGVPHYGFHVILDALASEQAPRGRTGLIFCTGNVHDEEYVRGLNERLAARGSSRLVRDLDSAEFAWLLQQSDIFVRATDRDGDAVAVREAAYYGKVAIASDCASRPTGVMLFRTGEARSLAEQLSRVCENRSLQVRPETVDTLDALREVYASVRPDGAHRRRARRAER